MDPNFKGFLPGEQPYSLRERVIHLENVVRDILQRMERTSPQGSVSPTRQSSEAQPYSHPGDPLALNRASEQPVSSLIESREQTAIPPVNTKPVDVLHTGAQQIENAPFLQLFNNNIVSRTEGTASRGEDAAATKEISPKAISARAQLLTLVPPRSDLLQICNAASHWWDAWHHMFPEISEKCRSNLSTGTICDVPQNSPGDIAKFLICILTSIEQLPLTFNFAGLENPFDPTEYTERCVAEINRLVIYDDDLSCTLPGLETIVLMAKWNVNLGRPRKAWMLNRRAVELGQLSGLHISTAKEPHPNDTLYTRRLKLWTLIGLNERFIGLILGLPYAIQESSFRPQVERRIRTETPTLDSYVLGLSLIMGPLVDRNQQDPANMSLAATLQLDQDLENYTRSMPRRFWEKPKPGEQYDPVEMNDRLVAPFFHHFIRALLHLPFMLNCHGDRKYQYSHNAGLESTRNTLLAFNEFRSWDEMNPFICRVLDFQAFTAAMLLMLYLMAYSDDEPGHSQELDDKDWALVDATTEVLRKVAAERSGTVAAQSLNILDKLFGLCEHGPQMSCKVSVPYFGVITLSPGKKPCKHRTLQCGGRLAPPNSLAGVNGKGSGSRGGQIPSLTTATSSNQTSPFLPYTPPLSNPSDPNSTVYSDQVPSSSSSTYWIPPVVDESSRIHLETITAFPNRGMVDQNTFTGFTMDDKNLGIWSNLNLDLNLDQGWNFDWSEDPVL